MKLTIDASVWVSAFVSGDVHHAESDRLLEVCLAARAKIIVPEIVLLEVAAAVARIQQDAGQGQVAAKKVERFPGIRFRPLQMAFLNKSILLATRHSLRAADALYLATAREARAALITLDDEMLRRGSPAATVFTPSQWLGRMAVKG